MMRYQQYGLVINVSFSMERIQIVGNALKANEVLSKKKVMQRQIVRGANWAR